MTAPPKTPTRSVLDVARDAIPDLRPTVDASERVATRLRELLAAAPTQPDDAVAEVTAAALAGRPFPNNLGRRVLEQRHQLAERTAEREVLQKVQRELWHQLRQAQINGADHALAVLRAKLDEVLADARQVLGELDVDDAQAALDAGLGDRWQAATRLGRTYADLRGAQAVIVSAAIAPPDEARRLTAQTAPSARRLVEAFGWIRDPDRHGRVELADDEHRTLEGGSVRVQAGRVVETHATSRPATAHPWRTGRPLDDLRFAARDDVTAWLPTVGDLLAHRDEVLARVRAAEATEPQPSRRDNLGNLRPLDPFQNERH